jgi:hypothetical protein
MMILTARGAGKAASSMLLVGVVAALLYLFHGLLVGALKNETLASVIVSILLLTAISTFWPRMR